MDDHDNALARARLLRDGKAVLARALSHAGVPAEFIGPPQPYFAAQDGTRYIYRTLGVSHHDPAVLLTALESELNAALTPDLPLVWRIKPAVESTRGAPGTPVTWRVYMRFVQVPAAVAAQFNVVVLTPTGAPP